MPPRRQGTRSYRSRSHSRSRSRSRSASPHARERGREQGRQENKEYKSPDRLRRAQSPDHRHDGRRQKNDDTEERGRSAQREEDEDPEALMKQVMGFASFGTTKNKKVADADVSGVYKKKKSEYRQYMNRQGGFNRSLSPPPAK